MSVATSHAQTLAVIRQRVCEAFRQHRLADGAEPSESILLKGGIYCGRRFEVGTGYAIWNAQSDELNVFSISEKVLCTIPAAGQVESPLRRAA